MKLKNFIKKKLEKDTTRFLVRKLVSEGIYNSEYNTLTQLIKYLKTNERKIENIHINLLIHN